MAKPIGELTIAPQPRQFGVQWHVIGIYPNGQEEHITGFKTEASALDWIANDSRDWLKKRRPGMGEHRNNLSASLDEKFQKK
jgi:hypothetical protein